MGSITLTRPPLPPCSRKRRGRIPAPVTRGGQSRPPLQTRNDSAPRWERRDTWVPPYGVRRSSRADRVVRPYKAEQEPCETGRRGRRPLHTLSLRGAKRRGNPFSPARRDGFPRQCVPQGHLLRGAHWRGMTAPRAGNGGTHGSRPTGCGGHPGRTESSAPTTGRRTPRAFVPLRSTAGRRPLQGLFARERAAPVGAALFFIVIAPMRR